MGQWILRAHNGSETAGSQRELIKLVRRKGPWAGAEVLRVDGEPVGTIYQCTWLRAPLILWQLSQHRSNCLVDAGLLVGLIVLIGIGNGPQGILGERNWPWLILVALVLLGMVHSVSAYWMTRSSSDHSEEAVIRLIAREMNFWRPAAWRRGAAVAAVFLLFVLVPDLLVWGFEDSFAAPNAALALKICAAALDKSAILADGQWWRLATAGWVHLNSFHLLANSLALPLLLACVARVWGGQASLTVLMGGILFGAAASVVFSPVTSVGISGGLCALLSFIIARPFSERATILPTSIRIAAMLGFMELAVFSIWVFPNQMDHYAHAGGLLAGALFAGFWQPNSAAWSRAFRILCLVFLVAAVTAAHTLFSACL